MLRTVHVGAEARMRATDECPGCGRVMSVREAHEQGVCNDCRGEGWSRDDAYEQEDIMPDNPNKPSAPPGQQKPVTITNPSTGETKTITQAEWPEHAKQGWQKVEADDKPDEP